MIEHIWSVLCRKSIIDGETNNISLLDIMERIELKKIDNVEIPKDKKIIVPIDFEIVSMWKRIQKEQNIKLEESITLVHPNGERKHIISYTFDFPTTFKRMRSRAKIVGIELSSSGDYTLEVSIKNLTENETEATKVSSLPLQIECI